MKRTPAGFLMLLAGIWLFSSGCGRRGDEGGGDGGSTLQVALLQNKAGEFMAYSTEAAQSALASGSMPDSLIVWVSDPEGKNNYPIVTYTWALVSKTYPSKKRAAAMKDLVAYCLDEGQKSAEGLGYIPLPEAVAKKVRSAVEGIGGDGDGDGDVDKLKGAGATFPAPLYQKWFKDYKTAKGMVVDYQPVGSGQGVKLFQDGVVDFGASDAAMTDDEIAKANAKPSGVVLLPLTAGGIVVAYNLPDVKNLKLTRDAYAGIFSGTITKWNDEAIAKANPGAKLPDKTINVITRMDSSGTTYVFTKHLSAISPVFQSKVGVDKAPTWPVGTKAKGNDGVTDAIKTTPGAIGYIEYGYAKAAMGK